LAQPYGVGSRSVRIWLVIQRDTRDRWLVIRVLKKVGFEVTRVKGSHRVMRHRDDPSRSTAVPVHAER
jgi:HicA-like toxin of HicAB toxin-antitoxin system